MKPKGQEVAEAIKEWAKEELKQGPMRAFDLGKFFFAVSSATIAALVSIRSLNDGSSLDALVVAALSFLLISVFFALNMVRPKVWKLTDDTDLYSEHDKQIKRAIVNTRCWFIAWLVGVLIGIYSVLFDRILLN